MKKKIYLILFVLLGFTNNIISQEIPEEMKQRIISDLDSTEYMLRWGAMEEIRYYGVEEAVPKLESIIWLQEPILQAITLQILQRFNSSKTYEYTLAFMDSVDNYSYELSTFEPLDLKIMATQILFDYNDFSTIEYVFQIIDRDRPKIDPYAREILDDIIKKVPEYADSAKAELLKLAMNNNSEARDRYFALAHLNELYGDEILPEIKQTFVENPDGPTRKLAMEFLFQHNYPELNSLIKERLPLDPDPSIRYRIAEALLDSFGMTSDYKFLQDYQNNEVDTTIAFLINSDLHVYRPLLLDNNIQIISMFDTLTSYTNQCYGYEWLKDEAYKAELLNKITIAKTKLNTGDSLGCRTEVASFQNSVNQVYQYSVGSYPKYVSNEGYKFLYYYAQYILERLPEPPAVEGLPVKLQDSQGNLLLGGSLQYYEGSWKDALDHGDGTFVVQTDRNTISLKMNYLGGWQQFNNVTVGTDTVVFQTVNTTVSLNDSQGNPLDGATASFYAKSWQEIGTTENGETSIELLPKEYSFRMSFLGGSIDKKQNIGADPVVVFQTVNATVQLLNSQNILLDEGTVQYYAGSWRDFGTTTGGTVSKELLPKNYSFRMNYAGATNDKQQNIGADPVVVFQTLNSTVQLQNSLGNLIDEGTVQYYAGSWRDFGTTVSGTVSKELLPKNYSFRMTHEGISNDKQQDIGVDGTVSFSTVLCVVQVRDSQNQPVDSADVKYYSGSWRTIGLTENGDVSKELLPKNLSFRVIYNGVTQNKQQDIGANSTVEFVVE